MAQRLKESAGKPDDPQFLPVFPWRKTSPESCPLTLDCHRCTSVHAPSLPLVNVIKLKILKNKAKKLDRGKEQDRLGPSRLGRQT